MYTPKHFEIEDRTTIVELIRQHSFATLLSYPENDLPFINHLPLIFGDTETELIGHMSKKNPQWQHFKMKALATALFHGPHAYISPRFYTSGRDVPTWNYAAVHVQGKIELIEDFKSQVQIIKKLTEYFEGTSKEAWKFELPSDLKYAETLTTAIISFKFHIEKIEAKFKLSQNRGHPDQEGVKAGLLARSDQQSHDLAKMMKI